LKGIPIFFVDPKNTSRTYSRCGCVSKSNRKTQSKFVCVQCGFSLNADLNASKNIALLGSANNRIAVRSPIADTPSLGTASPFLQGRVVDQA